MYSIDEAAGASAAASAPAAAPAAPAASAPTPTPVAAEAPAAAAPADAGALDTVKFPALAESIKSGTVAKWHFAVGDRVNVDDVVVTVATDKVRPTAYRERR